MAILAKSVAVGLGAGLVMILFVYTAASLVDLQMGATARLIGSFFTAGATGQLAFGRVILGLMALVWALVYARLGALLPGRPAVQGTLYGLLVWLAGTVILLPALHSWAPAAAGIPHPGYFALGFGGWRAAGVSLLAHLLYGVLVATYLRVPELRRQ